MSDDGIKLGANEWMLTEQRSAEYQEITASWKRDPAEFEIWASDRLALFALILSDQITAPGVKNTSQVSSIREVRDVIMLMFEAIDKRREQSSLIQPEKKPRKKRVMDGSSDIP